MANIRLYKQVLGVASEDALVRLFFDTLVETNRTHAFFVDWKKVKANVDKLRVEIALQGSLVGSKNLPQDMKRLLTKYPETMKAIPILIAVREKQLRILEDVEATRRYTDYHFGKRKPSTADIDRIVKFCERTGISSLLSSIQTLHDYVLGVEVGADTNARKNRSGTAMQDLIYPLLNRLAENSKGLKVVTEKNFKYLQQHFDMKVPPGLLERKFDAVVISQDNRFNIETNFYAGGGSKPQEIVDSYINRQRELSEADWGFIWITDGAGWRTGENQMRKAFRDMDYVLNVELVRKGMLNAILRSA